MVGEGTTADGSPRGKGRRSVSGRNRSAILAATASHVRTGAPLTMRAVAADAAVSRSTLYRHFASPAHLRQGLQQEAVDRAETAIRHAVAGRRPVIAELRGVVSALVKVGSELPLDLPETPPRESTSAAAREALRPLAGRLARAAGVEPVPHDAWLESSLEQFAGTCLRAGWNAPDDVAHSVETLMTAVTDPLDRGLVLLDAAGGVVACNRDGRVVLGDAEAEGGGISGGRYEDGAPAPPEAHPISAALAVGDRQQAVRGYDAPEGGLRWYAVDAHPLRQAPRAEPYGVVAVITDISAHRQSELASLRPPGVLGPTAAPLLDIVRVLDEIPPPLLPEQLIAEAMRLCRGPVALYVLDIDGSHLLRLAGSEEYPSRLRAPLALGPELAEDGLPDLTVHLAGELPGVVMAPMWLRGRAVGLLLGRRGSEAGLREVARLGAAAMELGGGYTDVFDNARRRKHMNPAAEIQQSLLPPRIVRMGSGELAGSVLPSYEVGGDWFDYVENRDGAWIAIADGAGRGPRAGGLSSVSLAALRAARRNGATLEQAAQTMDETVADAGGPAFFVTAVLARWLPLHSVFSWINLGHPPPLLIGLDGAAEELATDPDPPLGITERRRNFRRHQRRLRDGDRLILYTDGISRRRTADGPFDVDGIVDAVRNANGRSATAAARAIQEAVVTAAEDPLPDDAAVVVLATHAPDG